MLCSPSRRGRLPQVRGKGPAHLPDSRSQRLEPLSPARTRATEVNMSLSLPARPHLDLLKRQAKAALRVGHRLNPEWRLADAQRALARGYGHANWTSLKQAI